MRISITEYSKIDATYKLEQPSWMKVIVMLIAASTLSLLGYLAINTPNILIIMSLAFIIIVFTIGFVKQLSSGIWSGLQANKDALYIIGSEDGKKFVELPWKYLLSVKQGIYGLNKRGVLIAIDSTPLIDEEKQLIRSHLNVVDEKEKEITVSIPTGVVNRALAIQEIEKYNLIN